MRTGLDDEGGMSFRQVGDPRAHNLQILHERYAPGADTGETMLEHQSHEGGVVISGELEVTVGDEVRVLKAGDAYLFDSRVPHRFRNLSDSAVRRRQRLYAAVVVRAARPVPLFTAQPVQAMLHARSPRRIRHAEPATFLGSHCRSLDRRVGRPSPILGLRQAPDDRLSCRR